MPKLAFFFGAHFNGLHRDSDWKPSLVGLKALGLFRLPQEWTPRFVVIGVDENINNTTNIEGVISLFTPENLGSFLLPLLEHSANRLIIRSSASVEHIECRGWLESKQCDPVLEDIARVSAEIFSHGSKILVNQSGGFNPMAVIVQDFKTPRLYGHLSNERRVSQTSNRWLCEIETPTVAGSPKLSWLTIKERKQSTTPLFCANEKALEKSLTNLASWSDSRELRHHFEWVWDGERVWVVQCDTEKDEKGAKPSSSTDSTLFQADAPKLSAFIDATKTKKKWKKVESLKVFEQVQLPKANLFVLENEKIITQLAQGKTPPHIKSDLKSLIQSPIVIRTDFLTPAGKSAFLSPRSETLISADTALEWLKFNASEIVSKGIKPNQFCFLAHRYIAASAGAFCLAKPNNPRVRIDSIWGLPDGLLSFPHDSFEVDTSGKNKIVSKVRCKPYYLSATASGAWTCQKCFAPWDWKPSLDNEQLKKIADFTKKVATFLNCPVEIMFFVGVDTKTGYPPMLPWIHVLEIPDKLDEDDIFYYAGKPFTVSNEMDLGRLREAMIREQKSSKVYIRLRPSPDLLRSKEFVNQVATTANDLKIPVQLEGSVLSHIYYMLTRQKVRVRCASPFLPMRRQRFGKLVRDLVPVTIEAGGEHARTITVPKEQLAKLLKTKALEEAFELFWESDNSKSFEEMADVMEVILSACKAYGRDFKDLVSLAEKKRKERGGFEKGVVLIETSNVPLIGTEDAETPLFAENTLAGISNKTSIGYPPSRRPRLRGRDLAIPLIPPVTEDCGKHYIIAVPDEEYEFVLRYTTKEIVATIRKKSPAPPANQLELDLK